MGLLRVLCRCDGWMGRRRPDKGLFPQPSLFDQALYKHQREEEKVKRVEGSEHRKRGWR